MSPQAVASRPAWAEHLMSERDVRTLERLLDATRPYEREPVPVRVHSTPQGPVFLRPGSPDAGSLVSDLAERNYLPPVPLGAGDVVLEIGCGAGFRLAHILERCPGARGIGVDADPDACAAARATLAPFGPRAQIVHRLVLDTDDVVPVSRNSDGRFIGPAPAGGVGAMSLASVSPNTLFRELGLARCAYVLAGSPRAHAALVHSDGAWLASRVGCVRVLRAWEQRVLDLEPRLGSLGLTPVYEQRLSGVMTSIDRTTAARRVPVPVPMDQITIPMPPR